MLNFEITWVSYMYIFHLKFLIFVLFNFYEIYLFISPIDVLL